MTKRRFEMRRISIILLLVLILLPVNVFAGKDNQIQVLCQIFRLSGNVRSKISVEEDIWTTKNVPPELKGVVEVFEKGRFSVDADELEFKKGKCFWNGKELPIAGPNTINLSNSMINMIYSPEILLFEHSSGKVMIESKQPIQYFEKRNDGLFELKQMELETGIDLEITKAVEEEKKDDIELTDLILTIRSVKRREIIEGVNLPVGKPILGEQKYVFFFRVDPGEDYGILINPRQGRGSLLIRLRANSTNSGTYTPEKKQDNQPVEPVSLPADTTDK